MLVKVYVPVFKPPRPRSQWTLHITRVTGELRLDTGSAAETGLQTTFRLTLKNPGENRLYRESVIKLLFFKTSVLDVEERR